MVFDMWINFCHWINSRPIWVWFLHAVQNDFPSWFPFSFYFISMIERRDEESWILFSSWHKSCCSTMGRILSRWNPGFNLTNSGGYASMLAGIGTCPLWQPASRIRLGIVRRMNVNPRMDNMKNFFLTYSCQFCACYCQFFDDRVNFITMLSNGFRLEAGVIRAWSYPGAWNKLCLSPKIDIP